jgi:hypothetical protein
MPATSRNEGTELGAASRVWMLPDDSIGGAIVRRGFTRFTTAGAEYLKSGTRMTADAVRSIPMVNRRALSVAGSLDIYPVGPAGAVQADFDHYVISRGRGEYDVIEGRKLNAEPLSKEKAEALAAAS